MNDLLNENEILKIKDKFNQIGHEEKIGIVNINCEHPITKEEIPVYIANFVLDNYGEDIGCPAHDERRF